MKAVWALALITFKEGIRNRAIFGIALLALFLFGLNVTVAGFFMRDIGKVSVDMNLTALTVAGLLLVFFVAINLMSKDIDRKTIHLVLSKPISRPQYIWGKYLGLVLFVTASLLLLTLFSGLTLALVRSLYPAYFGDFSWSIFFLAVFFVLVKFWVLCAVVMFFSALTTSSLITLIFSFATYIAGVTIEEVIFYLKSELAAQERIISETLRQFIDAISWILPNFSAFDFGIQAAHGLTVSTDRALLAFGYGVLYSVILLLVASLVFSRREFN
mgnify:CR=1 FL=1